MVKVNLTLNEIVSLTSSVSLSKMDVSDWINEDNDTPTSTLAKSIYEDLDNCEKKLKKAYQEEIRNRLKDE